MAKKNKYSPEQLWDVCETITNICCTKCSETTTTWGDESNASDEFFDKGWRATPNNTYCPECAKKILKL